MEAIVCIFSRQMEAIVDIFPRQMGAVVYLSTFQIRTFLGITFIQIDTPFNCRKKKMHSHLRNRKHVQLHRVSIE